jgi:pimeloyl-ACP methyl ester carboxylesterase
MLVLFTTTNEQCTYTICIVACIQGGSQVLQKLSFMTAKQLPYKDASINYTVSGKGNAVVLLHGFAEDRSIWDSFIGVLSEQFLLLVPDLPGSGKSSLITEANTGLEDYAECIHLMLTKEDITECCMIGHSMGGYISLAFAEKYPGMLTGLGLFHSSAYADDDAKKETRRKAISFINEKGADSFLKTSIPGLFANSEKQQAAVDDLLVKGRRFSPQALTQYYEAMIARPDRTAVLLSASFPVLFILGKHDKAVPFDQGLKQSHLPAESHISILRESGHMGMIEEEEKALKTLADFLHSVYV